MKNGYIRNISRRSNMLTSSGEQGANSNKKVAAALSRAKPEDRNEITLENAQARLRFHCNFE
jgi:hypothetical protein